MNVVVVAADLGTIFASSLAEVLSDVQAYIAIALPAGLTIMGTFIAIRYGIKFFKTIK